MAQKGIIIIDTDILIKVYRGDVAKKKELEKLSGSVAVSIITILKLMQGVNSKKRLIELYRQAKAFTILHINNNVSELSYKLFKKYILDHPIRIQDSLIAATTLHFDFPLFTDNKKDYEFIEELNFIEKDSVHTRI